MDTECPPVIFAVRSETDVTFGGTPTVFICGQRLAKAFNIMSLLTGEEVSDQSGEEVSGSETK